jgi:hypothetical protein
MTNPIRFSFVLGALAILAIPLAPTVSVAADAPVPKSRVIMHPRCGDSQDCPSGQACIKQNPEQKSGVCTPEPKK